MVLILRRERTLVESEEKGAIAPCTSPKSLVLSRAVLWGIKSNSSDEAIAFLMEQGDESPPLLSSGAIVRI